LTNTCSPAPQASWGAISWQDFFLKVKRVVIIGRSSAELPLKERIRKLLRWFGIEHLEGLLEIHETDFLKKTSGLVKMNMNIYAVRDYP
jgi:hypothetical protein